MHTLIRLENLLEGVQDMSQGMISITRIAGSFLYNRPVTVFLRITILCIYAFMPALCMRKKILVTRKIVKDCFA